MEIYPTCESFSGDFQCSWGPIPISRKCDGVNNCGDNSDEENCLAGKHSQIMNDLFVQYYVILVVALHTKI